MSKNDILMIYNFGVVVEQEVNDMAQIIDLEKYRPSKSVEVTELQRRYKDSVGYTETIHCLWQSFIHCVVEVMRLKYGITPKYYQNKLGQSDAKTMYLIKEGENLNLCACVCSLSDKRGLKDGRVRFYVGEFDKKDKLIYLKDKVDNLFTLFELANKKSFSKCVENAVNWLQSRYCSV